MPQSIPSQPDLVIRDALLIDGSGAPGVRGDLAVKDDHIVAIGDLAAVKGGREIAAKGLALAPGFVDTHTHDDRALLSDPLLPCKISQGVTTVITGNCGILGCIYNLSAIIDQLIVDCSTHITAER